MVFVLARERVARVATLSFLWLDLRLTLYPVAVAARYSEGCGGTQMCDFAFANSHRRTDATACEC
jgi:hypothetical protein